jgi:hypothetical protein
LPRTLRESAAKISSVYSGLTKLPPRHTRA